MFLEPTLEERYFEFFSFYFPAISEFEELKIVDFSMSRQTVPEVSLPVHIYVVPPPPFVFQERNPPPPLQNQNLVILEFLLNCYAPLNLPQPINLMP